MSDQQLDSLAKSLVTAQAEMQNPAFDAQNPHFKSKYASLASVRNAIIPVLAKHGISLVQDLKSDESGNVLCSTILMHESGQMMVLGPLALPAGKLTPQAFGSAATYARRYSLQAVAGVVADEDDDANAAQSNAVVTASEKDISEMLDLLAQLEERNPDKASKITTWIKDTFGNWESVAAGKVQGIKVRMKKALDDATADS